MDGGHCAIPEQTLAFCKLTHECVQPSRERTCRCHHVYLHGGSGVSASCPEVGHRFQAMEVLAQSSLEGSHDPGLRHWLWSRRAQACQRIL